MKINQVFSNTQNPIEEMATRATVAGIQHPSSVTVPLNWSQSAANTLVDKYLRKAGIPKALVKLDEVGVPRWLQRSVPDPQAPDAGTAAETSAAEVFHRMAGCWTYWGWKSGYFDKEEDALNFRNEIAQTLINQMAAPNSPQWFNTGIHWAYGIDGPAQGHFYVDPATNEVVPSTSAYERPQPHACFIQSVKDDLVGPGGIMDLWTREARLFKYGSGTGSNVSRLRGEGERLSGGGKSSGMMSFLNIGDRAAGAIKSGGTTRRAAKMVVVDADHPDIEKFIDWKLGEENKVASLVAGSNIIRRHLNFILRASLGGLDAKSNHELATAIQAARRDYVPIGIIDRALKEASAGAKHINFATFHLDWEGHAYGSVSGQNSNNTVSVSDAFIEAALTRKPWDLTARTTGEITKTVNAGDLWDSIAKTAWAVADPGLHFHTTINDWHTCPEGGPIRASNPCSEYMFLDDTACNLASLNLLRFLDAGSATFDAQAYIQACHLWTIVLDISVTMAQFPSPEVARLSYDYRTLGLGYANLGALLMTMGVGYDSEDGRAIASCLTSIMTATAYDTSAVLAASLGAFPAYRAGGRMDMVIANHAVAAGAIEQDYDGVATKPTLPDASKLSAQIKCQYDFLSHTAQAKWRDALKSGKLHGYRNAQTTCIAPTGTISFVMDCDTTGIEPDFTLTKRKTLAGGGVMIITNESVGPALRTLGYEDDQIADIKHYIAGHKEIDFEGQSQLRRKGFSQEMLSRVASSLNAGTNLRAALKPEGFSREDLVGPAGLGLDETDLTNPAFSMIEHLGLTDKDIHRIETHVKGHGTIEGAPHIKDEHLSVFDCANPAGTGVRSLNWQSHLKMMSFTQPFISGAISKTINMPATATAAECSDAYLSAWKLGLKAVALYRDGSKLSQPLMSAMVADSDLGSETIDTTSKDAVVSSIAASLAERIAQREKLPAKRFGYTQKSSVGGHKLYIRTGNYKDGRLGEIFLDMHKEGTAFRALMNNFAMAISIGLQYGVPLEEYVDAYVNVRFEPAGMVIDHPNIKITSSLLDYVFRDLAINYLDRFDLANVRPELIESEYTTVGQGQDDGTMVESVARKELSQKPAPVAAAGIASNVSDNRPSGLICDACGSVNTRRTGSCAVCDDCQNSIGGCG